MEARAKAGTREHSHYRWEGRSGKVPGPSSVDWKAETKSWRWVTMVGQVHGNLPVLGCSAHSAD